MSRDDDTLLPENSGRDHAGRWKKGASGNRAGKPRGTRHRATKAVEVLLDNESKRLTRKAVELALAGDVTALRICMDRICPPRKERPVDFRLPQLVTPNDAAQAMAEIVDGIGSGELCPGEAQELGRLVEAFARTIEVRELEDRLTALEKELRNRAR